MGWKEGQGLGKNLDGIVDCIQIERRDELKGLGFEKRNFHSTQDDWESIYNKALAGLKEKINKSKKYSVTEITSNKKKQKLSSLDSNSMSNICQKTMFKKNRIKKDADYNTIDEQKLKLFSSKLKERCNI